MAWRWRVMRGFCRATAWGVEELQGRRRVSKSWAFLRPSPSLSLSSRRWSAVSVQVELEKDESSSIQKSHNDLWEVMGQGQLPSRQLFHGMLEQCSTSDDINRAFRTTERLRVVRAVRKQMSNFDQRTSLLLMRACIRAGDLERAMTVLYRFNVWGLTPSLEAAHELLVHLALRGDVKMVQQVLRLMAKNGLHPVPETASVITRALTGNAPAMVKIAREFDANGISLCPKTIDRCMATSASYGFAEHVLQLERVRAKQGLPLSTRNVFALAQAYLLLGNVEQAASVIKSFEMDKEDLHHEVKKMVKSWPSYLQYVAAEGSVQVTMSELKKNLEAMVEQLRRDNVEVSVDVQDDFATLRVQTAMQKGDVAQLDEPDTESDDESKKESELEDAKQQHKEQKSSDETTW